MKAFSKFMSTVFEALGVIIKLFLLLIIVAIGFGIYNAAVANPSSSSADSNGLFVGKPIDFIKKAVASKKLAVEIVTNQEQFITVFDLTGLEPLAAELADTCNWKL